MNVMDQFRLDGQVAVVTGAGRGIGRAIALALAEAGADVAVAARRTNEIEAVADEIRALGRNAAAITTDMMVTDDINNLADETVKQLGKLTCWVNNAGGADDRVMRDLIDTPESQWDFQSGLNLKAVWLGSVAAARKMENGGTVINISSVAAAKGSPNNGPYGAAKAGVNQLTQTLSLELAPKIRVNAIAPGPIPTEVFMEALNLTEEALPGLVDMIGIPLQRMGAEEDIAPAAVYLASDASSWVTGQILSVTGGL